MATPATTKAMPIKAAPVKPSQRTLAEPTR